MAPFSFLDFLITDDLTILLALVAVALVVLNHLYKPQPLVHPILLGRQSDVGRARNPGESAVYRNYGTGLMGRFPLRPSKEVHVLADLVRSDSESPRTLWSTQITNIQLQDRVAAFGTGLLRLVNLQRHESSVLLLLNDCIEFVLADLALASHSIPSFTLTSQALLSAFLDTHSPSAVITHASLLPQILELIYDAGENTGHHTVIVVGDPTPQTMASVASQVKILRFTDVEREGMRVEKIFSPLPNPSDVFTVSFHKTAAGQLQGAQFTHENITAGVAAVRALFPMSHTISPLDTIASAHSLSTAYGRVIVYTAIYEGTSFATFKSSEIYTSGEEDEKASLSSLSLKEHTISSPTVVFIKPEQLHPAVSEILARARKSWIFPIAHRHKLAALREGHFTKDSFSDRSVFDGARAKVLGDCSTTLRGVIIAGGPIKATQMTLARVALSVPLINCFMHPLVAGPVLASHCVDVQDFTCAPENASVAHVGPPTVNLEAKLVGVDDEKMEKGEDPLGALLVKGPTVGKLADTEDYVDAPAQDDDERWVDMGSQARIYSNGTFQILSSSI